MSAADEALAPNVTEAPQQPVTLRAAVIGVGWAGGEHLASYAAEQDVQPLALAGLEVPRLQMLGARFGIDELFEDWQALLARTELDVLSVCAPNYLHAPIAIAALEAGVNVLCEKPMACTLEDASAMVEAARRAGKTLQVVSNYRHRQAISLLHELVTGGFFGRIRGIRCSWLRRESNVAGTWFGNRALSGGGVLADLGVHLVDLVLYLLDDRVAGNVTAMLSADILSRAPAGRLAFDVEDSAVAVLRIADGPMTIIETSWAAHSGAESDLLEVTLYGSEADAVAGLSETGSADTLEISTRLGGRAVTERVDVRAVGSHREAVHEFVETVRVGTPDHGERALLRARVVSAIYEAAACGREVVIDGTAS